MELVNCKITIPEELGRLSKERYFFSIALLASKRSPCPAGKRHGAVLTNKGYIISVGYNGPPSGKEHCKECLLEKYKNKTGVKSWDICPAVHAEENAIITAARFGMKIDGLIMYATKKPCEKCIGRLINSGIIKTYYLGEL